VKDPSGVRSHLGGRAGDRTEERGRPAIRHLSTDGTVVGSESADGATPFFEGADRRPAPEALNF